MVIGKLEAAAPRQRQRDEGNPKTKRCGKGIANATAKPLPTNADFANLAAPAPTTTPTSKCSKLKTMA